MLKKDEKVGDYTLIEKVGSGGFGEVWKAEKRTSLSISTFAIKFFRTKDDEEIDLETVIKEVEIWQKLSGLPHIISVIEGNQFEDYVYIVSEFADGGSLDKWLRSNGGKANSYSEAVSIIAQILQGLEGMHSEGFVHRDLKPANVLVKRNILYLADFGISRQMKTHSKTTGTAGTYDYMPPEAFESKPLVSVHTDIWAAGVLLQKLLTGSVPFPQKEIPSLMGAIMMREPEPLSEDVPIGLKEIVKKALQKKRENRFQSAREMHEALRDPQKFLDTQALASTETIDDKEFETDQIVIEPTQDWRVIEAGKERQRQLVEAQRLKEIEEAKLLQENETKKQQAEISSIGRGLRSNPKPLNTALKIIALLMGVILLPILFGLLIKGIYNENFPANKVDNTNTQQVNNNSNEIKVEFKDLSDPIAIEVTVDGQKSSNTITPNAPQTFTGQQSVRLRYYKGYTPDKIQLMVNGKKITPPDPPAKGNSIEFEINKNNIAQILSSGYVLDSNATAPSSTPNNPATLKNSIGMEFVKISAGSFMMGSENGESNEKPVHKVTILNDFYLGKYEVTQAQWKAVMGNLPTSCGNGSFSSDLVGENKPIVCVSWEDVQEFIKKLNVNGETYRLPTEAEWEYAARAGTTGDYAGDMDSMAWDVKNSGNRTHEVGTKQANPWGLYDMQGNVWEWCQDWYGVYPRGGVNDPAGATSGSSRVTRGGSSWTYDITMFRSAYRFDNTPSARDKSVGFRLLRIK